MDNAALQEVLAKSETTQLWIKPVGDPQQKPDLTEQFTNPSTLIEFAKRPRIKPGDILFVYRIGVSKIIYAAACLSQPAEARDWQKSYWPWLGSWRWMCYAENLTPNYGACWNSHNLKPFSLLETYLEQHPDDAQTLGALKFGSGQQQISPEFAEFIIQQMMDLG